jgi:zinc protease
MRRFVVGLFALLLVSSAHAKGGSTKPFPFPMAVHTLPNGLRVVFVTYDSPGLVGYYTLMRVGSRNEPEKGRSGYAHFFEHMMFRGTKTHSAEEYNKTVTKLGLNTNAFTGEDMTVYHLFGPAKALPTIIDFEADRFQHLDYGEAEYKTEAGAILGEYAKSASNPMTKLEEKMMETAYTTHTYRHTTIGYLDDVKAMPSGFAYSREFFKRYYTPDNATVIVVGDFDRAAALQQITAAYASWAGKVAPAEIVQEPPQTAPREGVVAWKTPTLARLWLAWHAPSANDVKSAAIENVLNAYLFGPTSTLYQDLILGRQLVDSLDASYNDHRDAYLFGVIARVKDDANVPVVQKAIESAIAELKSGKVDMVRLNATRSNLKYGAILQLDTADRVAEALAVMTAQTGDLEYFNKLYAAVDKLSAKDLSDFAKKYLDDNNRTTVTLTGKAGKGGAR